jgi:hypothetical protein
MNYLIDLISKKSNGIIDVSKVEENKLDSRITMADNSYLKSIIGEIAFTELESGIEQLMDWARHEKVKPNLSNWIQSTI